MAGNRLTKKLRLTSRANMVSKSLEPLIAAAGTSGGNEEGDVMTDSRYLRQSATLINDALQKGFDVLQLANGDIVTTGTKTIVTQYSWDDDKGKLVKLKSPSDGKKKKDQVEEFEEEDA